jgi:hypothetical protein
MYFSHSLGRRVGGAGAKEKEKTVIALSTHTNSDYLWLYLAAMVSLYLSILYFTKITPLLLYIFQSL